MLKLLDGIIRLVHLPTAKFISEKEQEDETQEKMERGPHRSSREIRTRRLESSKLCKVRANEERETPEHLPSNTIQQLEHLIRLQDSLSKRSAYTRRLTRHRPCHLARSFRRFPRAWGSR